jgi:hypothetical protein
VGLQAVCDSLVRSATPVPERRAILRVIDTIPLHGSQGFIFGITIAASPRRYYLLDNERILGYDANGEPRDTIGRPGSGPSDIRFGTASDAPAHLALIGGRHLAVLDSKGLVVYDRTGRFIGSVSLTSSPFALRRQAYVVVDDSDVAWVTLGREDLVHEGFLTRTTLGLLRVRVVGSQIRVDTLAEVIAGPSRYTAGVQQNGLLAAHPYWPLGFGATIVGSSVGIRFASQAGFGACAFDSGGALRITDRLGTKRRTEGAASLETFLASSPGLSVRDENGISAADEFRGSWPDSAPWYMGVAGSSTLWWGRRLLDSLGKTDHGSFARKSLDFYRGDRYIGSMHGAEVTFGAIASHIADTLVFYATDPVTAEPILVRAVLDVPR